MVLLAAATEAADGMNRHERRRIERAEARRLKKRTGNIGTAGVIIHTSLGNNFTYASHSIRVTFALCDWCKLFPLNNYNNEYINIIIIFFHSQTASALLSLPAPKLNLKTAAAAGGAAVVDNSDIPFVIPAPVSYVLVTHTNHSNMKKQNNQQQTRHKAQSKDFFLDRWYLFIYFFYNIKLIIKSVDDCIITLDMRNLPRW